MIGNARSLDRLCDDFESEWKKGHKPSLDQFLAIAGEAGAHALPDLVILDLEYRLKAKDTATAGQYFARYPELLNDPALAVRMVAMEYQAEKARDPELDELEMRKRYPELAKSDAWLGGPWITPDSTGVITSVHNQNDDTSIENRISQCEDPAAFLTELLTPSDHPNAMGMLDEYRVMKVIGFGGMGVVVKAYDPQLDRLVAIKLIRPSPGLRTAKDRFLQEARAVAKIQHPRVIAIYRVAEFKGSPYLVMPLLEGQSLAKFIKAGPVPIAGAVQFVREAADGLVAVHAKGMTHRDIKPDNIWLEQSDEGTHVRLLDFGLARGDVSLGFTKAGTIVGSPNYMAPEQASGEQIDARADLFSLGCVLYELLTGRKAFQGKDILAVLSALAVHNPPPPREVNAAVPQELSEFTIKLLRKDPDKRIATAAEVSAFLKSLESSPTMTVSQAEMLPPQRSRKAVWIGGVALSFVIAVVVIVWNRNPKPDNTTANTPPTQAIAPLQVERIEVKHFVRTPDGDVPKRLGVDTFMPSMGDKVQVFVKLSRPAYSYLIAFRPDGVADLCFPEEETTIPPLTDTPQYPTKNVNKTSYGLNEGSGLWIFGVITSETPLPAYSEWVKNHPLPWKPKRDEQAWDLTNNDTVRRSVWFDTGKSPVEVLTPQGISRGDRGKGETVVGQVDVEALTDFLKQQHSGIVGTVGFYVAPKK